MSGGGGSTTSTGTTYTSSLPEYAEPYYRDLMERTASESQSPYVPYQDQRIAGFQPESEQAFQQVGDIAADPLAGVTGAMGTAADVAGYQSGYQSGYGPDYSSGYVSGYGPGYQAEDFDTQRLEGYDLSGYINPYVQQTLDVQSAMAQRRFDEQQAGRNAAAVQAGAFGGTRGAVANALAQRDLNEQLMAQEAQGMQSAYEQAQQMFMADEARALQAAQLGLSSEELAMQSAAQREQAAQAQATLDMQARQQAEAAAQAEEQARLAAAGQRLVGAEQQAGLDQLRQQLQLESAEALAGVGAQRQQQEQRGLDQAYQDFVNQRDFERQQLSFYSSILHGTPVTPQSEVITSQPSPSGLSQLLGGGLGAYGLYGLLNG